jgi:site-specific DNA-methyltransferase (adenine-specific)
MATLEVHEICSIFPEMTPEEFADLKADIDQHGQREPVWTYQSRVIDGRNRVRACKELGIEPQAREWDGAGSLVAFVTSLNLVRRHLTEDQRAHCAADAAQAMKQEARARQREGGKKAGRGRPLKEKAGANSHQPKREPRSSAKAAQQFGVKERKTQEAAQIAKANPQLHEKVKSGEMSHAQAKRQVARQERRKVQESQAQAVERALRESAGKDDAPWRWSIVEGDCLKALHDCDALLVQERMEPGRPRLICTDPPYNIGIKYGRLYDDRWPRAKYLEWTARWIKVMAEILAPDGSLWVLINHENAARVEIFLKEAGMTLRAWITWYETFGQNVTTNFNRTSHRLLYALKDPQHFVFNPDAVNRPSDRQAKYGDKRADPGGKIWDDVWILPRLVGSSKERLPDVPTQLPLALLLPIIGCASEPGDLILDPFSGGATTGEAALRLGRRYIGIELLHHFASLSRQRLQIVAADILRTPTGETASVASSLGATSG